MTVKAAGARLLPLHEGERLANWIHAVAHRMEGDAGNAAYWYARCGRATAEQLSTEAELSLIRDELASH